MKKILVLGFGTETWRYECNGVEYKCSAPGGSMHNLNLFSYLNSKFDYLNVKFSKGSGAILKHKSEDIEKSMGRIKKS